MRVILLGLVCLVYSNSFSQRTFDYYVSNDGHDTSTGNSVLLPKKTVASVASAISNGSLPAKPLSVGFRSGDVFNETFAPGFPVDAGTYFPRGAKAFSVFNGTAAFDAGWTRTDSTSNVYQQYIPLQGFKGYGINSIGQYSFVSVLEIDRATERTAPFSSRKVLKFCNSLQAADATPGSFYEPITADTSQFKIYIHTSDGSSPNNNPRYRYEVTVRDRAFNSTYQQNNVYERMWLRGYGAGNGMIAAGANSTFNRMIFGPAAGIHHLGLRGATINNSLFLPSAQNTNAYAVVFYDTEGFGRHNAIKNSVFLDIRYPIYSHKSYGSTFGALELDNVIAFADTLEGMSFFEISDTDSAMLNNSYANGFRAGYNYGHAPYFSAKNTSFINVVSGFSFGFENTLSSINNCFVKTRGNVKTLGIGVGQQSKMVLSNSILHIRNYNSLQTTGYTGVFVENAGADNNQIDARGNIFIADVQPSKNVLAAIAPASGKGAVFQNNVYVLLRGNRIDWYINKDNVTGAPGFRVSFDEWKRRTGNDTKSLFFDLRNDPRGLKAIFADPDNGDYSLANTLEGNMIKAIRAGMINPVTCFLKKPSYEEAAYTIMHDGVMSANVCSSPCIQNKIRTENQLAGLATGRRVQLNWNIGAENGIERFDILRSFGNTDFTKIGSANASGVGNYSFTDSTVQAGTTYNYSVAVVTSSGEKCYSSISSVTVQKGKAISVYPNPTSGIVTLSLNGYTGPVQLSVTNLLGVKVFAKQLVSMYGVPLKADLSTLRKGMYWIKAEAGKEQYSSSFVIR